MLVTLLKSMIEHIHPWGGGELIMPSFAKQQSKLEYIFDNHQIMNISFMHINLK